MIDGRRASSTARWALSVLLMLPLLSGLAAAQDDKDNEEPRDILRRNGTAPQFRVHGFADVNTVVEQVDGEDHSFFALGEFDLYFVGSLSNRISFLAEIVFETNDQGDFEVDVERLFLKYSISDPLAFTIGRVHTPFGYWNVTYHHGFILQPTIRRPEAWRFEDNGGILPVHNVGLSLGGRVFAGEWSLDYAGLLSNGRGPERGETQNSSDANQHKAGTLRVSAHHRGFTFGGWTYVDEIPPLETGPLLHGTIDERIWGGHFVYANRWVQVLAEYFSMRHDESTTGERFDHEAYYVVAIAQPWKFKPYLSFDRMQLQPGDPYFDGLASVDRYLAGLRWDLNKFNAIKFELQHEERPMEDRDALAVQFAFMF